MNVFRQVLTGAVAAFISGGLVLGGLAISMAEGNIPAPVELSTPTSEVPRKGTDAPIVKDSPTPGGGDAPTPEQSPTPELSETPRPTSCPPPSGWVEITTRPGDTLDNLAQTYKTTPDLLAKANCLLSSQISPESNLYVPPLAAPTIPPPKCGPYPGWVFYTVQNDDNLYRLSLTFGTTVWELQVANCLGNSTYIRTGNRIYVPNVPPIIFTPEETPTQTPTLTFTASATASIAPTDMLTPTDTSAPTDTPTPTDTLTPTETPTPTGTPTPSPTATETPTPSDTPSPSP